MKRAGRRGAVVLAMAAWAVVSGAGAQTAGPAAAAPAAASATVSATASAPAPASGPAPSSAPAPAPARADVDTIDGIVAALYDVISGSAGKPRDWDRMRGLFAPEGRLQIVAPRPDGSVALRTMSVEDYIARNAKAFATTGFFEREAARTGETFGQIAHVFSTYESRHAQDDAKPFQRGINSIQLVNDGKRWWIVNLVWRAEDAGLPLPERYLPKR
ncbi:hypothetical protein [Massilia sp. TN1-12]|uniref:hypothetical protein n=1 Tax=Massilia paldalensis TaxID=3377675 RepID=UPI00384CDCF1